MQVFLAHFRWTICPISWPLEAQSRRFTLGTNVNKKKKGRKKIWWQIFRQLPPCPFNLSRGPQCLEVSYPDSQQLRHKIDVTYSVADPLTGCSVNAGFIALITPWLTVRAWERAWKEQKPCFFWMLNGDISTNL